MYQQEHISASSDYAPIAQVNSCSTKRKAASKTAKTMVANETAAKHNESTQCQGGVCLVTWKPQRPAA